MTFIYSNDEVEGVSGAYIAPHLFDGVVKGASEVYTDDVKIIEAYKSAGVEVKPIKKKK